MRNDPSNLDTVIQTSYKRIYSFALKLTGNLDDASDLTQETFVRAHRARDRRLPERNPDAWLFRIAYHCFLDSKRTAKRRPSLVSTEVLLNANFDFDPPDSSANPEQLFFQNKLSDQMSRAWESLTEQQRSLIHLAHFDEMTHKELAEIFGCGATTIKTRIHRAHVAMKQHLALFGFDSAAAFRRTSD